MTQEACPVCNDEDYLVLDYRDSYYEGSMEQHWECKCEKCGTHFSIEKLYELTNVIVTKGE